MLVVLHLIMTSQVVQMEYRGKKNRLRSSASMAIPEFIVGGEYEHAGQLKCGMDWDGIGTSVIHHRYIIDLDLDGSNLWKFLL